MRICRLVCSVAFAAILLVLNACGDVGHESSLVEVSARHANMERRSDRVALLRDARARRLAADVVLMKRALAENAERAWLEAAAWAQLAKNAEVRPGRGNGSTGTKVRYSPPASAPSLMPSSDPWITDGYDWRALAQCETGSNWTMHGNVYSTAFGIMNGAQEMTPAALNGTASPEEQLQIAIGVERRAGIDAWGCAWAAK